MIPHEADKCLIANSKAFGWRSSSKIVYHWFKESA